MKQSLSKKNPVSWMFVPLGCALFTPCFMLWVPHSSSCILETAVWCRPSTLQVFQITAIIIISSSLL